MARLPGGQRKTFARERVEHVHEGKRRPRNPHRPLSGGAATGVEQRAPLESVILGSPVRMDRVGEPLGEQIDHERERRIRPPRCSAKRSPETTAMSRRGAVGRRADSPQRSAAASYVSVVDKACCTPRSAGRPAGPEDHDVVFGILRRDARQAKRVGGDGRELAANARRAGCDSMRSEEARVRGDVHRPGSQHFEGQLIEAGPTALRAAGSSR